MNNLKQLETREVTVGENIFYMDEDQAGHRLHRRRHP